MSKRVQKNSIILFIVWLFACACVKRAVHTGLGVNQFADVGLSPFRAVLSEPIKILINILWGSHSWTLFARTWALLLISPCVVSHRCPSIDVCCWQVHLVLFFNSSSSSSFLLFLYHLLSFLLFLHCLLLHLSLPLTSSSSLWPRLLPFSFLFLLLPPPPLLLPPSSFSTIPSASPSFLVLFGWPVWCTWVGPLVPTGMYWFG